MGESFMPFILHGPVIQGLLDVMYEFQFHILIPQISHTAARIHTQTYTTEFELVPRPL